ncbi:MAG: hypothetical protein IPF66_23135 [Holophagales bacterium]|nr:hypothetical protein [Holophagales bacterium]
MTVVPAPSEGSLRLRTWMEENCAGRRPLGRKRSAGVLIPGTRPPGVTNFNRYYFSEIGKGGPRRRRALQPRRQHRRLHRRPARAHAADGEPPRGRERTSLAPAAALSGPKVMLINEMSGSGGDALPWYFRKANTGKLVGKRTWGGLVGICGYPPLLDGGSVTAPASPYGPDGSWEVENVGIAPDVEVEEDPYLVRQGNSPQLGPRYPACA